MDAGSEADVFLGTRGASGILSVLSLPFRTPTRLVPAPLESPSPSGQTFVLMPDGPVGFVQWRMAILTRRQLTGYAISALATALAALLSWLLRPYLAHTPYALFGAACAISAWYGGLIPGLLSVAVSILAGTYIFLEPSIPLTSVGSVFLVLVLIVVLIDRLRVAEQRAMAGQRRTTFLSEASRVLASSLDYETTLQTVARLAVPRLADWCVVYVREDDEAPRPVAVAAEDPTTERLLHELALHFVERPALQSSVATALHTGQPQFVAQVSDSLLASVETDQEALHRLRELGTRSYMVVPLIAREQRLGALVLAMARSERRYMAEDRALAEELARRAATAIDSARLYRDAQAAIRRRDESLALLDTLLAGAPAGLAFLDRDFRFIRLNDALAAMIGPPRQEILGHTVREMVPQLWPTLGPLLRGVLETGESAVNLEVTGETEAAPGQRRSWLVSYYPVRIDQGDVLGIGVVVVEITERKRAEEEREHLLEQVATERIWLLTVIERSPIGIVLADETDGLRLVANRRAEELFGHPLQPLAGIAQYAGQVLYPDGTPYPYERLPIVRALRGETVDSLETRLRQPGGREVPTLVSAVALRDREDRIRGAVVACQDISALKELERLREEWTSVIAHDLRQPVTIILGYADRLHRLLQRRAPMADQETSLEHIRVSAANLNRMIADLLDFSRIEAHLLTLQEQPVDLPGLVQTVVERMAAVTAGHPVRVVVEDSIPRIEVDPGRIEQVLDNLISNAAKYGYPNTDILVAVARRDHTVELAVTNRGDGIPPEDLPNLFTRFYRRRTALERRVAGLGLGLYITRGIVEAHGGRIWAESIPGQTTTFHVTLPLRRSD